VSTFKIRSISELSCPVLYAGLTKHEIIALEGIQRTALVIIRGTKDIPHTVIPWNTLHYTTLESRGYA